MRILKRLSNLWKLSGYELIKKGGELVVGDTVVPLVKRAKMATIIKKIDPIDEIING